MEKQEDDREETTERRRNKGRKGKGKQTSMGETPATTDLHSSYQIP